MKTNGVIRRGVLVVISLSIGLISVTLVTSDSWSSSISLSSPVSFPVDI
jgi:hypothetical protein